MNHGNSRTPVKPSIKDTEEFLYKELMKYGKLHNLYWSTTSELTKKYTGND